MFRFFPHLNKKVHSLLTNECIKTHHHPSSLRGQETQLLVVQIAPILVSMKYNYFHICLCYLNFHCFFKFVVLLFYIYSQCGGLGMSKTKMTGKLGGRDLLSRWLLPIRFIKNDILYTV